jgi:P27 family predicted phage terminase small subunit
MSGGTTGNKPVPTALKILRSSSAKAARLAKRQIETPGDLKTPPDWLDDAQKQEWAYAVENAPRNVLRRIDKAVLAAFIVAQDTHRRAVVAMQTTQLLVKSPTQQLPIQNPYLPIVNRQAVLISRIASELGFTPCSRARIEASGGTPVSQMSDWDEIASA